jgi:hypothetical protein
MFCHLVGSTALSARRVAIVGRHLDDATALRAAAAL